MITVGSRLQLMARAEVLTGRSLGYLNTFEASAMLQQERYVRDRRAWRDAHPGVDMKALDQEA